MYACVVVLAHATARCPLPTLTSLRTHGTKAFLPIPLLDTCAPNKPCKSLFFSFQEFAKENLEVFKETSKHKATIETVGKEEYRTPSDGKISCSLQKKAVA